MAAQRATLLLYGCTVSKYAKYRALMGKAAGSMVPKLGATGWAFLVKIINSTHQNMMVRGGVCIFARTGFIHPGFHIEVLIRAYHTVVDWHHWLCVQYNVKLTGA